MCLSVKRGRVRHLRRSVSDELRSPAPGIFEPRCSVLDEVEHGGVIGVLMQWIRFLLGPLTSVGPGGPSS